MSRLSRADHADRLALYKLGYSDCQIAKLRGLDPSTVRDWRQRNNLPARHAFQESHRDKVRLDPTLDARRMARYRLGWSDAKIGAEEGSTRNAITMWRRRRGLVGNEHGKPHIAASFVSLDAEIGEDGFDLHGLIADDAAAAWLESVGATRST